MKLLSSVRLFATPWTVAYQAPPSMGFSRQECWSGLPFPSPRDLPDPGIEPGSPTLQTDALLSEPPLSDSTNFKTEAVTGTNHQQPCCDPRYSISIFCLLRLQEERHTIKSFTTKKNQYIILQKKQKAVIQSPDTLQLQP